MEVVLLDHFWRDIGDVEAHVLIAVELGVQVEIGDVHRHITGIGCGEHRLPMHFDELKSGGVRAHIPIIG